jgi:hypothetical protein
MVMSPSYLETASDDGFLRAIPTNIQDSGKLNTFNAADPEFQAAGKRAPDHERDAGWLPSIGVASQWKTYVSRSGHSMTPAP